MKQLMFFLILCFGAVFTLQAQMRPPVQCSTCEYVYKLIGQRKLVGESRNYYGSEKRQAGAPYSAKPTSSDRELRLGDVFPAMGKQNLFWNYSPDGMAHLTELGAETKVFKRNGYVYAYACENLLELATAPVVAAPSAPTEVTTIHKTVVIIDTVYNTVYNTTVNETEYNRNVVQEDYYEPQPEPYYDGGSYGGYAVRGSYTSGTMCSAQPVVPQGWYAQPVGVCNRCGQSPCRCQQHRVSPRQQVCGRCGQNPCGCRNRGGGQTLAPRPPRGQASYASNGSYYGPRTGGSRTTASRSVRRR